MSLEPERPAKPRAWRRWPLRFLFWVGLFGLCLQAGYFTSVLTTLPKEAPAAQMVLVYSGGDDRVSVAGHWADPKTLFLFSGWDYNRGSLGKRLGLGSRMLVEDKARTTDQNARYSAPLIRAAGVQDIVLALPWYHLPRALFLTRLYLRGTGVTVTPYASTPLPSGWALRPQFWEELFKFWGSLGRVGLASLGWETGPSHRVLPVPGR